MNVLSLFSGIGGLDLGLERAGMTVVGQVEIDPWCRSILAKHWPEVPRHDDVRTAAEWWQSAKRPAVDLIAGGFPCQPVSQAGLRLAQADHRWLWPAMASVIGALRPRCALMENVPGLLARGMGDVLGDLAELGYDAEWDCISAADVGAPHLRKRVWIVAYSHALGRLSRRPRRPAGDCTDRKRFTTVPMADADSRRLQVGAELDSQPQQDSADRHPRRRHADRLCHEVANADGATGSSARPAGQAVFRSSQVERPGRCGCRDGHTWATEPGVGRVAHGIPRRVDRLRGLGNAVVPQVAEHIGRLIMSAEATA